MNLKEQNREYTITVHLHGDFTGPRSVRQKEIIEMNYHSFIKNLPEYKPEDICESATILIGLMKPYSWFFQEKIKKLRTLKQRYSLKDCKYTVKLVQCD